jgi:O-antigen ligase
LQQSPWIGLGFWADRYFLHGANIQSTIFDALMQSGFLGMIPFVIAFVWLWVGILRFYSNKPAVEASSLPGELLAVVAFLTVYSITEITFSFYSVGWVVMAPLVAHVQYRVHQRHRERSKLAAAPAWLRNVPVTPAVARGIRFIQEK